MTNLSGDNQNRTVLIIGTVVAVALVALALFAVGGKQNSGGEGTGEKFDFDLSSVPFVGKADASVTMVVVEDFKCGACKTFQEGTEAKIKTKYVDTGKVKLYTIIWPFIAEQARLDIDDSKIGAQAVKCAFNEGVEQFDELKTYIFRIQGAPGKVWATKDRMKELAAEVNNLDQEKFATCLDNDETAALVDAEEAQVQKMNITNTPSVFINGEKVKGSVDAISKAIDSALE